MNEHEIMSKRIFISHAAKDQKLADALVDLLQTGMDVKSADVFCSSLDGLGIPAGEDFIAYIKGQIKQPDVVLALISPNYLASQFCLCELGASWALSHKLLPLLVPPLKHADVQGVLKTVQVNQLDSQGGLSEFIEGLRVALAAPHVNTARWGSKSKAFLEKLPGILSGIKLPDTVTANEHAGVKQELKDALEVYEEAQREVERLTALNTELGKAKDRIEVASIVKRHSTAQATFEDLVRSAAHELQEQSRAVSFVAFRTYSDSTPVVFDPRKDPDAEDDASEAAQKKLLLADTTGYTLNDAHPRIRKLTGALDELRDFLNSGTTPADLFTTFEAQTEIPLEFDNREFWESQLDKRIKRVHT